MTIARMHGESTGEMAVSPSMLRADFTSTAFPANTVRRTADEKDGQHESDATMVRRRYALRRRGIMTEATRMPRSSERSERAIN
jgi:hypothetical protein